MQTPKIVTEQEWEEARQQLLVKEKEVTRARDALAAQRRRMPWLEMQKAYAFDGPDGKASLAELFEGIGQFVAFRIFDQLTHVRSVHRAATYNISNFEPRVKDALFEQRHDLAGRIDLHQRYLAHVEIGVLGESRE